MNEWGIPDWRDKLAYGDVGAWSEMRWRWEFRRRLDEFRAECDAIIALYRQAEAALEAFREERSDERREAYGALVDKLEDMRLRLQTH
ncbi:MAG: hypothetical protein JJU19_03970 [Pararhodobacter sp.]|nr:hypothetical protein [Pararhodobacter sp.]